MPSFLNINRNAGTADCVDSIDNFFRGAPASVLKDNMALILVIVPFRSCRHLDICVFLKRNVSICLLVI